MAAQKNKKVAKKGPWRVSEKVQLTTDRGKLKKDKTIEVHPNFAKILVKEGSGKIVK